MEVWISFFLFLRSRTHVTHTTPGWLQLPLPISIQPLRIRKHSVTMSRNTYAKLQQRDDDSSSVAALFASHLALAPQDSFELDSLASSTHDHSNGGGSGHSRGTDTPSSRGLSPLRSPIGTDYDVDAQRDHELDSEDYQHLLLGDSRGARTGGMDHRHARTGSVSTLGSLVFSLPTTRDRRAEMEVPLEKQKRLSLFDGLSLVIGLQIG